MAKISGRLNNYYEDKLNLLLKNTHVTSAERLLRKLIIPGFDGMPVYDVAAFFIRGLQKGAISMRAAAFSYNFFLALFPAIIFFFTIIPYIPIAGFQDNLLELLRNFIPKQTFGAVEGTLFDIIKRPNGGLLSLGFVMAIYFSTNGIHSLIVAFNQSRHTKETRSWIKQRLISIVLVFILSLLVIIAIVLISFGPVALDFLVRHNMLRDSFTYYMLIAVKWIVSSALLFFAFSFLYYLAPAAISRFRFFSAGSTLSTVLTILASVGFNYYVNSISQYNTLYGSIGTLIIIMVWIFFNAMIVLIGFELNVSIRNAKRRHARHPNVKPAKAPATKR